MNRISLPMSFPSLTRAAWPADEEQHSTLCGEKGLLLPSAPPPVSSAPPPPMPVSSLANYPTPSPISSLTRYNLDPPPIASTATTPSSSMPSPGLTGPVASGSGTSHFPRDTGSTAGSVSGGLRRTTSVAASGSQGRRRNTGSSAASIAGPPIHRALRDSGSPAGSVSGVSRRSYTTSPVASMASPTPSASGSGGSSGSWRSRSTSSAFGTAVSHTSSTTVGSYRSAAGEDDGMP
ncbi:hypothetical protein B0H19DRAFT_1096599 [Mycena capillaripes]|nr:hypothetical protein B0H19DRAFT_1096599 [Mycena capillaripes]